MTYTEAKSKILAARKLTETSPFKLERGYVYASLYEVISITHGDNFIPPVPDILEKHIWGIDSESRLVRI